jgi:hypothetical protein
MARLYTDEDFDRFVVVELRRLGHDVLTMQEDGCGNRGVPDRGVIALARQLNRAVVTFNRQDFIRLHAASNEHKGILVCTRDPDSVALAGRIHQQVTRAGNLANQLLRINRPSITPPAAGPAPP